jgi:hypothetical protein
MVFACPAAGQGRKLYVDHFHQILGNPTAEKELLAFVEEKEIEELILYDLHRIHAQSPLHQRQSNGDLARFIAKAKTEHRVKSISASGESGHFFQSVIHPYNVSRQNPEEQFDVYNIEFEYWNPRQTQEGGYYCENYLSKEGLPCTRANAFAHYIASLNTMRELRDAEAQEVKIEAYLGQFSREEAEAISEHIDRLLIHDYVHSPEYSYLYVKDRLNYLDAIHSHIEISILFSEENQFMGPWLRTHDFHQAEEAFFQALEQNNIELEKHLNFQGFTYFNYSFFRDNDPN